MVKLVEELTISSDVLVDVLVQVGFLDKAFTDGNVSRIDSGYYRDGVNTYNITVEKEINLKEVNGDCESCTRTYEEKKENPSLIIGSLINTPCPYLIKTSGKETILSKEDTEKLSKNIHISDKSTTNIADILNNDKFNAEKFAQEFIERINTMKDIKGK